MLGDERTFRELLEKTPPLELMCLNNAVEIWKNPSVATKQARDRVVFLPRSNCHRVKQNLWFAFADMESRRIITRSYRTGWQPGGKHGTCTLTYIKIEQLALASLFCDMSSETIGPLLELILGGIYYWNYQEKPRFYPNSGELSPRPIFDLLYSQEFREFVADNQARLPREVYTITNADTGSDIINSLKSRILDPATPSRDIAALTKELTKRQADRRRLFPHLGF